MMDSGQQTKRNLPRCTQSRGRYRNVPMALKRWVYKRYVLESNYTLLRTLYPMVKTQPRRSRKKIYKMAIQCHRDNRKIYDMVMG